MTLRQSVIIQLQVPYGKVHEEVITYSREKAELVYSRMCKYGVIDKFVIAMHDGREVLRSEIKDLV